MGMVFIRNTDKLEVDFSETIQASTSGLLLNVLRFIVEVKKTSRILDEIVLDPINKRAYVPQSHCMTGLIKVIFENYILSGELIFSA